MVFWEMKKNTCLVFSEKFHIIYIYTHTHTHFIYIYTHTLFILYSVCPKSSSENLLYRMLTNLANSIVPRPNAGPVGLYNDGYKNSLLSFNDNAGSNCINNQSYLQHHLYFSGLFKRWTKSPRIFLCRLTNPPGSLLLQV